MLLIAALRSIDHDYQDAKPAQKKGDGEEEGKQDKVVRVFALLPPLNALH